MFPTLFNSLDPSGFQCDECIMAKHHWVSYPISSKFSSQPFNLIHSDIWGPSKIANHYGAKWFISFIDDCTHMCWVFLLKDKTAIGSVLPSFCKMIYTQFGTPIKKFRTDNARDYFNNHLHQSFQQEGIIHESSCIDTPQQNGVAERKMRHLLNVTQPLLHHHHAPKKFWREAVLTATYVINRVPSRMLQNRSPFQQLASFFPDLTLHSPLPLRRVFGCVCFVHIPKVHRDKLDPRALIYVFLGYSLTQKGYKCYYPTIENSMSQKMSFLENQSFFNFLSSLQQENSLKTC